MPPNHPELRTWSPPRSFVVCGWLLTGAALVWWLSAETAVDALFVGVLVLLLAAASGYGTFYRPRLSADSTGITVRRLSGTHRWAWSRVDFHVRRTQRLGRKTEALELEVPAPNEGTGLVILGKFDLGEDPQDVAETLRTLRDSG